MNSREYFSKFASKETMDRIVEYDTFLPMWDRCLKEYRNLPSIIDEGKTYSYEELNKDASSFRGVLKSKGLKKGDRVGILAENGYPFVKMLLACLSSGIVAAILPPHLDEKTVYGCTLKFNLKGLLYSPVQEEKVAFSSKVNPNLVLVASIEEGKEVECALLSKEDPAVIMFTGGTTGKSKGALLSQGALLQGTVNGCYGVADVFNQRYLLVLPLSHVFGLIRNLMTSLYTGSTLYIVKNNKDMFRDCAIFNPTIMVMVPALAEMCLNLSKQFKKVMLGNSLKTIICGAALVSPYLIEEYEKLGIHLLAGYGLTETANLVCGNPESLTNPTSIGYPYPNQEFKIVDGELWIKGANMMDGYVGDDEENKLAYSDGWFKTGDLIHFDDKGMMYITGRCKEIIVLPTGENISPAEMETVFNELDIIQDSQVFEDVDEAGHHFLSLEVVPRMVVLAPMGLSNIKEYVTEKCRYRQRK